MTTLTHTREKKTTGNLASVRTVSTRYWDACPFWWRATTLTNIPSQTPAAACPQSNAHSHKKAHRHTGVRMRAHACSLVYAFGESKTVSPRDGKKKGQTVMHALLKHLQKCKQHMYK